MGLVVFLIIVAIEGILIGALARLALPGKDPMTLPQTMAVGLAGALIAGAIAYFASDGTYGAGFLASFVVAVLIMYVIRRRRGGGLLDPGAPEVRRRDP